MPIDPERLLDSQTTALLVLDAELRLQYLNPAAEALLGTSSRQALGAPLADFLIADPEVRDDLRRSLLGATPYTAHELPLALPAGATITVDCSVTPLSEEAPASALLVELRQVDALLRISREEALIAQHHTSRQLIRNLAHEVKNPLGGLRGAAQLLERELPDAALREYTQVIIGEADRLGALVDGMLGPNRPVAHTEVNIHEVLERVYALLLAEAPPTVRLERDYDPSIPSLLGDAGQLIQALLNLGRNALQALPSAGGMITLRSRVERRCLIGARRHKLAARIDVIDTGPGIPPELGERIFYPMISGRAQGSGLGLPLAQVLASQHGGLIEYQSRPGDTVFTLLLPLEDGHG